MEVDEPLVEPLVNFGASWGPSSAEHVRQFGEIIEENLSLLVGVVSRCVKFQVTKPWFRRTYLRTPDDCRLYVMSSARLSLRNLGYVTSKPMHWQNAWSAASTL